MRYFLLMVVFLIVGRPVFAASGGDDFESSKRELLLRKIGHEVLLHSGDSTSRVLPVKKVAENEYLITFENQFTFQSDTLVSIVRNVLHNSSFSQDYIVNVLNCDGTSVQFGYAISGIKQQDIISCSGRKQPKRCYLISLKFKNPTLTANQKSYLIVGLPFLAFVGLMFFRSKNSQRYKIINKGIKNPISINRILFDVAGKQLLIGEETIELTVKESRILLIFARSPNEVIERSRLQKEIWEDEGVIVGRSLDVFISKLRKKLENDPMVQLVNIHSKGYKLVIES